MARYLSQLALLLLVAAFAWRRGEKPERVAALILVTMAVADPLYHAFPGKQGLYDRVDFAHAAIDFAGLAAMVGLALRADRFWTLWLGALQLIACLAHVLRAIEVDMPAIVYAIIIRGPFWAQIVLVGFATWLQTRRRRRAVASHFSLPS